VELAVVVVRFCDTMQALGLSFGEALSESWWNAGGGIEWDLARHGGKQA
jgi:hypothetical protein